MNARQRGSALPAASVLRPNRSARDAASARLKPCRGSASLACSTCSALSVCHGVSGASAWRSAPGTSPSLVCTGPSLPGELRPRQPEPPPPTVRPLAERPVRVAAPPILKEAGGIHPSILPLGPRLDQVPILAACGAREGPGSVAAIRRSSWGRRARACRYEPDRRQDGLTCGLPQASEELPLAVSSSQVMYRPTRRRTVRPCRE